MSLLARIQTELMEAMKAKDEARLSTLRMLKSALKKQEVDSMKPLDEAAERRVLNTLIKQRREAAEMFRQGGRQELAEKEEVEARLIEAYLPAAASEAELNAAVEEAVSEVAAATNAAPTMKQMGLVMKAAQARLAGKSFEGKQLSELVKARLSG